MDSAEVMRILDDAARDTVRLRWLVGALGLDGLGESDKDIHDHAMDVATEEGHDEPDSEDYFWAFRRLIDAAMSDESEATNE